jgi:hypothetical protein
VENRLRRHIRRAAADERRQPQLRPAQPGSFERLTRPYILRPLRYPEQKRMVDDETLRHIGRHSRRHRWAATSHLWLIRTGLLLNRQAQKGKQLRIDTGVHQPLHRVAGGGG